MIENISIGTIASIIAFAVSLIGGIKYLHASLRTYLTNLLEEQFREVNNKIDGLDAKLNIVELDGAKNYIVPYLADMERGGIPDEIERQRFWDSYEVYIRNGGNSYIKDRVETLQKEGKL